MKREAPQRYVPALGFRWLTPAYDLIVRATTREKTFKSALARQAGLEAGHRVLDLGCGTGTLAIQLAQRCPGATLIGVDGDPDILRLASRKAARLRAPVQFDRALASALPYAGESFDRVVSSLFFHHLSRKDKGLVLREAFRVLRRHGELHIADWGGATGRISRAAFLPIQLLDGFANTSDNVRGLLPELMRRAGFEAVEQTRRFPTLFGNLALYRARRP